MIKVYRLYYKDGSFSQHFDRPAMINRKWVRYGDAAYAVIITIDMSWMDIRD